MRLISWQRLAIIASIIWVVVGPTYFHLSREDNDKRIARDQYQLCIQKAWSAKSGVERCNKDLRQALAFAHWSSWAQLAFIPVVLAWFVGGGLFLLVRRIRSKPQEGSGHDPQEIAPKIVMSTAKSIFPAPWRVETIPNGLKVVDATGLSLAYVYFRENPNDAQIAKVLTEDEAQSIASNIAKLPTLLGKGS